MQNAYNVSAIADPEIPPETQDRINRLGEITKEYDALWTRFKDGECISKEEWDAMARLYKDAGFEFLPRPLAARVGEDSYRTVRPWRSLPADIDEKAFQIIHERGGIKPDHLAGILRVSRNSVGRIVCRLKQAGKVRMDHHGHGVTIREIS